MGENRLAFDNMKALLKVLGGFRESRYSNERPEITLLDGSVDDSFENYALVSPWELSQNCADSNLRETVEFGLDFFSLTGRPHIWPVFPGSPINLCDALEDKGLVRDEDFHSMAADTDDASRHDAPGVRAVCPVRGGQGAREWAECAWLGFGAIEPPPDSFVAFAGNMAKSDAISLLYIEGAATGMLCAADGTAGIYYVSTRSQFRGRGLGGIVVETLKRRALEMGFGRITLLATPSGLPLYLKHGFRDNGAVKIYKTGE